jgi:hypothetical protein
MKPGNFVQLGDEQGRILTRLVQILDGRVTLRDQIGSAVTGPWISTDTTGLFACPFARAPRTVVLLSARSVPGSSDEAVTYSGGSVSWSWSSGFVRVLALPDLAGATRYTLDLLMVED